MCLVSFALWVPPVEHVQSKTRPAEVADIITSQKNCGHRFLCLHFLNFCLAVAVDLDVVPEL